MMSSEILFLYPLLLDPCPRFAVVSVCVCLSVCPSRARVTHYLPHRTGARDPHPLRRQRYLSPYLAVRSEIEHCEPLPLRVPLARSRPPAERHSVSNKALLSKQRELRSVPDLCAAEDPSSPTS